MADIPSRYRDVPILNLPRGDGEVTRYLARRFPAAASAPGRPPVRGVVRSGDRPDLIAARVLGSPLAVWRLAELNLALDPRDLTSAPGREILLPAPGAAL